MEIGIGMGIGMGMGIGIANGSRAIGTPRLWCTAVASYRARVGAGIRAGMRELS